MSASPGLFWTLLSFLLVIGPLVFVHELGHYFAGRIFGVHAEAFSIGFGEEVFGWTDRRGTRWKVGWAPLGGYVKFAGDMNPASVADPAWKLLPEAERKRVFQSKPVWQRFLIVLAGPATNLIVAVLIFASFIAVYGEPRTSTTISTIEAKSAAAAAGIRPGDRITAIDGTSVDRFEDLAAYVQLRPGAQVAIDLVRAGEPLRLDATLARDTITDRFGNSFTRGLLGVSPGAAVIEPVPALRVLPAAVRQTWTIMRTMADGIGQIVMGRISVKELGGPIRIAKLSGESAAMGPLAFITFVALISINLGFINLLPIPMLDGGHLLFYGVEAVRRRPLPAAAQEWAFRTGLALLLSFMIFVTVNDLATIGLFKRLSGLIG